MKVWHANIVKSVFGFAPTELSFPQDYVFVATVDTTDPEWAFQRTNSVRAGWWFNEDVKPVNGPTRSTSVGDVIVSDDGKTAYLVLPMGMKRYAGVPQKFPGSLYNLPANSRHPKYRSIDAPWSENDDDG